MLLRIAGVMNEQEVAAVVNGMERGEFIDGRETAGNAAGRVKQNLELDRRSAIKETLARAVVGSLYRSAEFRNAVLPGKVGTPIFSRYRAGMQYGSHVDDPVMGEPGAQYRSDVSCTVFLSSPESYTGGELTIRTSYGEQRVKLNAGDAVVYPSHSLHRVDEVTAGERLAAVLWIQSLVRDAARRELLYELATARETLLSERSHAREAELVDRSYVNLLRMWAET